MEDEDDDDEIKKVKDDMIRRVMENILFSVALYCTVPMVQFEVTVPVVAVVEVIVIAVTGERGTELRERG